MTLHKSFRTAAEAEADGPEGEAQGDGVQDEGVRAAAAVHAGVCRCLQGYFVLHIVLLLYCIFLIIYFIFLHFVVTLVHFCPTTSDFAPTAQVLYSRLERF
jgi:hypothetical protein